MTATIIPQVILDARDRGALLIVSHRGGKDSQAMTSVIRALVPDEQIVLVHAELPGVDWSGIIEHIEATTTGLELRTCVAVKTFFEMVRHRRAFPSPKYRQCTSDLKRGPIEKLIRAISKERGILDIVSCIGIRADESSSRSKLKPLKDHKGLSKAGRTVIEWLPIFDLTTDEVWATIDAAGQEPHEAYYLGMSHSGFNHRYPVRQIDASHPDLILDHDRCIFCGLCVRASREADGKNVFAMAGRGKATQLVVNTDSGKLGDSDITLDDAAAHVCPVGAIMPKHGAYSVPIGERYFDGHPIDEVDNASGKL